MIRVLVADDSATLRNALSTLLAEDPQISVVGEARDGVEAVSMARALRPDVITMDVNMPRLDGLGATAAIMADSPARVLVISSVSEHREQELSFKAMAAGALELIAKPASGDMRAWGRKLAESIRLMAEVPVVRRHGTAAAAHWPGTITRRADAPIGRGSGMIEPCSDNRLSSSSVPAPATCIGASGGTTAVPWIVALIAANIAFDTGSTGISVAVPIARIAPG